MSQEFLSAFSPRQLSQETLEDLFVAREDIAQKLIQAVRDSTKQGIKRHSLIVGPRGMGKTHLLSILYYRLHAEVSLKDKIRIARLSEEEYGLLTFFHVLYRTLNVLADTYKDVKLRQDVDKLREIPIKDVQVCAEKILKNWLGDKTLIILAENLDEIFSQLKDSGQRALRAFIQTQQQTVLLVTTPSVAHSLTKHAAPFYGFFEVTYLKELDANQGHDLLIRFAKHHPIDSDALVARLEAGDALPKIRAIEHLAGGHPRLWFLFSEVLAESPLDDLTVAFRKLIDQLTPYYQSKMKDSVLSDQERAIVETIALHREPMPVKEIAKDCFLEPNLVSAHLTRIVKERYVRPEKAGRESYYELSEPLLRLVLETRSARDQYLPTLLDFLAGWYTKNELNIRIHENNENIDYLSRALDLKKAYMSEAKLIKSEADIMLSNKNYEKALDEYRVVVRKKGADAKSGDWFFIAFCLHSLSRYKEAIDAYDHVLTIDPKDKVVWTNKGDAYFELKKYNDAINAFRIAEELGMRDMDIHVFTAISMIGMGKWGDVFDRLRNARNNAFVYDERALVSHYQQYGYNFCRVLISRINEVDILSKVSKIVEFFESSNHLGSLGIGLSKSIPLIFEKRFSNDNADLWLDLWKKSVKRKIAFEIPIYLLSSANDWKKTRNRKVLLQMSVEERKILEQLLPVEARGE